MMRNKAEDLDRGRIIWGIPGHVLNLDFMLEAKHDMKGL